VYFNSNIKLTGSCLGPTALTFMCDS